MNKRIIILVFTIVLLVIGYKVFFQPWTFNPAFGVQNLYGFQYYDSSQPISLYFVMNTSNMVPTNTSTESDHGVPSNHNFVWTLGIHNLAAKLNSVRANASQVELWFAGSGPLSDQNGSQVLVAVDNFSTSLALQSWNGSGYTWDLPQTYNIPGSNFAVPVHFSVLNLSANSLDNRSAFASSIDIKISATNGVHWTISSLVIALKINYETIKDPWWQQNFTTIVLALSACVGACVAWISLKVRSFTKSFLARAYTSKILRNPAYMAILLGVAIRILISPWTSFWGFDSDVYRNVGILSYYLGLDTRPFLSIYGGVWQFIVLLFFPLSFVADKVLPTVPAQLLAIKLPLILSDGIISLSLYRIGFRFFNQRIATLLAIVWIANPYSFFMSAIWGNLHVLPTMFAIVAFERLIYSRIRQSAVALALAAFSATYCFFLIPIYIFYSKGVRGTFLSTFLVSSSLIAVPWMFSPAIFTNTVSGPSRIGFPYLTYWTILSRVDVLIFDSWERIFLAVLAIGILLVTFVRPSRNPKNLLPKILLVFLIFYLTSTTLYQTYILISLPILLILTFSGEIPLSFSLIYYFLPLLWTSYWMFSSDPPVTGTLDSVFRDVFALDFSLIAAGLVLFLALSKRTMHRFERVNILDVLIVFVPTVFVFSPWVAMQLNLNFLYVLQPFFFIVGVASVSISLLFIPKLSNSASISNHRVLNKANIISLVLLTLVSLVEFLNSWRLSSSPFASSYSQTSETTFFYGALTLAAFVALTKSFQGSPISDHFVGLLGLLLIDVVVLYSFYTVAGLLAIVTGFCFYFGMILLSCLREKGEQNYLVRSRNNQGIPEIVSSRCE